MSEQELNLKFNFKWTPALAFLILTNLIPVFGVLAFGWDVETILLLYWLETIIVGLVNVPKMWSCEGGTGEKIFITIFFAVHFGMFSWGHLTFLKDVFDIQPVIPTLLAGGALAWAAAGFLLSHIFSMFLNFYGKKEYAGRKANEQMFFPYGRVVVMHVVIIIGSGLVLLLKSAMPALIILIMLKIAMDIAAHSLEHAGKPMHTI